MVSGVSTLTSHFSRASSQKSVMTKGGEPGVASNSRVGSQDG